MTLPSLTPSDKVTPPEAEPAKADRLPHSAPPETRAEIEAMRRLASDSFECLMSEEARRETFLSAADKLLITVIGLLAVPGLLWLWSRPRQTDMVTCAGLASFMVGILWATQFAVKARRLVADTLARRKFRSCRPECPARGSARAD